MARKRTIQAVINLDAQKFRNELGEINSKVRTLQQQFKEGVSYIKTYGASFEKVAEAQAVGAKRIEELRKKQELYTKQLETATSKHASMKKEADALTEAFKDQERKVETLTDEFGKNSKEVAKAEKELEDLAKALQVSSRNASSASREMDKLEKDISKAGTEINQTEGELRDLSRALDAVDDKAGNMDGLQNGLNIQNFSQGVQSFVNQVGGAIDEVNRKIIGFGKGILDTGIEYASSTAKVQAYSGATVDELTRIETKARELGKTTMFSAAEVMDGFGYMALAGYDVEESLNAIDYVLRTAQVSQMDFGRASDLITDSMSAFGYEVKDMPQYLDALAEGQTIVNASTEQLLETFIGAGGILKMTDTSIESAIGMMGSLATAGIKSSEAGTAMNSILTNLSGSTAKTSKAFGELGVEVYNSAGEFNGYESVLLQTSKVFEGLTDEEKNYYATQLAGKTQMDSFNALMSQMANGTYSELKTAVQNSNGALQEQYDIFANTPEAKVKELKSRFEEMQLSLFEKLLPTFERVLDILGPIIDKIGEMDDETFNTILTVAGFSLALGPVFKMIGGGISLFGSIAQIIGVFGGTVGGVSGLMGGLASIGSTITGVFSSFAAVLSGPVLLAIAGVAVAAVGIGMAIKEGMEPVVEEIDIFEDRVENIELPTGEIHNGLVSISDATKEALDGIIGYHASIQETLYGAAYRDSLSASEISSMNDELVTAQNALRDALTESERSYWSNRIAEIEGALDAEMNARATTMETLKTQTDALKAEAKVQLEADHAEERALLEQHYIDTSGLTGQALADKMALFDEAHQNDLTRLDTNQSEILAKAEQYMNDEIGLTGARLEELLRMNDEGLAHLTSRLADTEIEDAAIRARIKDNALNMSAVQMGGVIKDAEASRQAKLDIANQEYEGVISALKKQHEDSDCLTEAWLISETAKAQEKRDKAIEAANEEKIGVLKELEEQNSETYNQVDSLTGDVLSIFDSTTKGMASSADDASRALGGTVSWWDKLKGGVKTFYIQIKETYERMKTEPIMPLPGKGAYTIDAPEIRPPSSVENFGALYTIQKEMKQTFATMKTEITDALSQMEITNENVIYVDGKRQTRRMSQELEKERRLGLIIKGSQRIDI